MYAPLRRPARLDVLDRNGNRDDTASPTVDTDRHRLSAPVEPPAPGDYTVKLSVVAQHGHRTEGSYSFTLGSYSFTFVDGTQ